MTTNCTTDGGDPTTLSSSTNPDQDQELASGSKKLSESTLLRRSLSSHQRSDRLEKMRLRHEGQHTKKPGNILSTTFQHYMPFSKSRENVYSDEFQIVESTPIKRTLRENVDEYIKASISTADTESQEDELNMGLDSDETIAPAAALAGDIGGDGGGAADLKSQSSRNRLKRNIKNTGSLIVRKFTSSSKRGEDNKKDKKENKNDKTATTTTATAATTTTTTTTNTKPKVAMLRTTTL